jgi:hypothetical protein
MKSLLASAASLLAGFSLGWYIQNGRAKRETAGTVDQMLQTIQSSDGAEAARDVRAIDLIESGDMPGAVHLLSRPIAEYYWLYPAHAGTNDQRLARLRSAIEQLAATNQILAAEMTNAMVNFELHGRIH